MHNIIIDFSRRVTEEDVKIDPLAKHCAGTGAIIRVEEGWQEELRKNVRRMLATYETFQYRWWWNQWRGYLIGDHDEQLAYTREPLPASEHDIIKWAEDAVAAR